MKEELQQRTHVGTVSRKTTFKKLVLLERNLTLNCGIAASNLYKYMFGPYRGKTGEHSSI